MVLSLFMMTKDLDRRARALYGKKRPKWVEAWSAESWATFEEASGDREASEASGDRD